MLPKVGPAEAPWIVGATAGLRALDASGVKGPGDRRKNQANLRRPCGTAAGRWPTTAGCSDACQPSSKQKRRVTRRNPTVPGGFLVEAVETPWVQESADDQQDWAGELV